MSASIGAFQWGLLILHVSDCVYIVMHVNAVALTECAAAAINGPALCHLDVKAHKLHA